MNYFTFVSEELPAICRDFFPNMSDKREDTLAAGLSMGGYGAWSEVQKPGYDLTCHESTGDHQWIYWDEHIKNVLKWWNPA
ncbi:MAG: hypothetical protein K2I22_01670 [Lachnospiraceae bacterium]|nr:hypothetical protein [Lachnospiraceae bacterium]